MGKILVAGAGGFIGGHVVKSLLDQNKQVRAVDRKPLEHWFQCFDDAENLSLDLQKPEACARSVEGIEWVYNFAANMGGMGFIENNKASCMFSVLINTHLLQASQEAGVERFLFASSACVYNEERQADAEAAGLAEKDAYPAMPTDGYGWEKLFSERMCRHFTEDLDLMTKVIRYHNVYGPAGTFDGGREKAPAAIARKVIQAKLSGHQEIEIWGSGEQTRSFMYIDDCLYGTQAIMQSDDINFPINLGSQERVTINQLVDVVEDIAGIRLKRLYKPDAPTGVNGRNSDNTLIRKMLNWEPSISLRQGMENTYAWIYDQIIHRRSDQRLTNLI